jgi:hypothetical protein
MLLLLDPRAIETIDATLQQLKTTEAPALAPAQVVLQKQRSS